MSKIDLKAVTLVLVGVPEGLDHAKGSKIGESPIFLAFQQVRLRKFIIHQIFYEIYNYPAAASARTRNDNTTPQTI